MQRVGRRVLAGMRGPGAQVLRPAYNRPVLPWCLVVCLTAWPEWPEAHVVARGVPKTSQRVQALDEMQRALEQWQRERKDFVAEQRAQAEAARLREQPELMDGEKPPWAGRAKVRGRSKVIEVKRDRLQGEIEEAEADVRAHAAECAKNPKPCEERRKQAELIEKGNEAWDQAAEAAEEKRRAQIEEDARRFQAELDAAKRREAERDAKKLGGRVDGEGNFVDDDLRSPP